MSLPKVANHVEIFPLNKQSTQKIRASIRIKIGGAAFIEFIVHRINNGPKFVPVLQWPWHFWRKTQKLQK